MIKEPEVLQTLQAKIQRKIQAYERMATRYETLHRRLAQTLTGQLEAIPAPARDPHELLRRLLKAT